MTYQAMKIIYFIDHLRSHGGTQRVLAQLVRGLAKRGHSQTVVYFSDDCAATIGGELDRARARTLLISRSSLWSGIFVPTLLNFLKRERFDVAVTLLFASDLLGRTLAHLAGIPRLVSSIRARNIHYASWQCWLLRRTMRWADAVILNSARTRDFAVSMEGAMPGRIHVIPNSIDTEPYKYPYSRPEVTAQLGMQPTGVLIGTIGRLVSQKGFDVLLASLVQLTDQDATLLMVGDGPAQDSLVRQAAALGISKRVHFAGFRSDVPRLMGSFDLYVHPARFEGMPNAVLEAMAAGCPIVATNVDGTPELIEDGQHGWLVPPENVSALADAMDAALKNPTEARRRGRCAQARAESEFSEQAMVLAWERALHG